LPGSEKLVIQEFRISRFQVLVSVKCLLSLTVIPLLTNYLLKNFLLIPVTENFWNRQQNEIFLNSYQQDRAFEEIRKFEEKIYFEFLTNDIDSNLLVIPINDYHLDSNRYEVIEKKLVLQKKFLQEEIQEKTIELAIHYNQESIIALTNLFGDFITFGVVSFLVIWMKPQIIILKSFLTESIYSLSDTTKSFLLILGTDLLVGFHSPRGWEICLELILRHLGFPENQDFIYLFVATFPVLLDTVFKYWIFRYLNQISPSTVATYHSMIE